MEGGAGVGGELGAEGVERLEAAFFAEEPEEFQFYGLPVDAAVEFYYVGFDAFRGIGGVDRGAVSDVDHRRIGVAVVEAGSDGVNAVGGNEPAWIGGEDVGSWEAYGASEFFAVDHCA